MHRLKRFSGKSTSTISERVLSGRILMALKIGLLPATSDLLSIPYVPHSYLHHILFKSGMHRLKRIPGESTYSHLSKVFVKHPAALTEPLQREHFSSRKLLLPNNNGFCAIKNNVGEYQDAVEPISMISRKLK